MLNTRMVGINISKLRKEMDMTQMELADRVNVSHQAVSKWERGESMPDIGTLPELAKVFGVSIDVLLGNSEELIKERRSQGKNTEGELIAELSQDKPENVAAMINFDRLPIQSVIDLAPIIKTSTMDRIVNEVDAESFHKEKIVDLAPFLSDETLDHIVETILDTEADQKILAMLLPYLSDETNRKFIDGVKAGKLDSKFLVELAPFLSDDDVDLIVDSIFTKEFEHKLLLGLLPFLSDEKMDEVAGKIMAGMIPEIKIEAIAPFLGEDVLTVLINQMMKKK